MGELLRDKINMSENRHKMVVGLGGKLVQHTDQDNDDIGWICLILFIGGFQFFFFFFSFLSFVLQITRNSRFFPLLIFISLFYQNERFRSKRRFFFYFFLFRSELPIR